jgi:DNA polymerase III epsilon subunit-like protein
MDKILYIDVETNGIGSFRPPKQRVVQLGYIIGNKEVSEFIKGVEEVNEKVPHPYNVEFLQRNGVDFKGVMLNFLEDLKQCTHIVAHNIKFDLGCLVHEMVTRSNGKNVYEDDTFKLIFDELNKKNLVDTMLETVNFCKIEGKYGYKWPKLEELYQHCFLKDPDVILHDALNDCKITRECFEKLSREGVLQLSR